MRYEVMKMFTRKLHETKKKEEEQEEKIADEWNKPSWHLGMYWHFRFEIVALLPLFDLIYTSINSGVFRFILTWHIICSMETHIFHYL